MTPTTVNKTCAISVEGVLRNDSRSPTDDGNRLYWALSKYYKLLLCTNSNSDEINRWLGIHGFKSHFNVYSESEPPEDELQMKINQLYRIREDGERVDLFIDPNPEAIAHYIKHGVTGLLYVSPRYSAPMYRPDYDHEVKPWDQLNKEMSVQYEARNRWKDAISKDLVE